MIVFTRQKVKNHAMLISFAESGTCAAQAQIFTPSS